MRAGKRDRDEQESNIVAQAIFRYVPYWPLFLALFLAAGVGAWMYIRYKTPVYQSTARILIKDEKKGAEEGKTIEDLNQLSGKKIIENESEVIKSAPLMNEVVKRLGLYAPVSEQGKIRNASAYQTSPVRVELKDPELATDIDKVFFSYDTASSKILLKDKTYTLNTWLNAGFGTIRFVKNPAFRGELNDRKLFFTILPIKSATASIQKRIKAEAPTKQSSILDISLQDEVPQRAEDILNELMIVYNRAAVNDKNILAANTLVFLDERLKSVEKDLSEIESRNQKYKVQQGAIDIGEQGRLFLQNVSANDQKIGDMNMQLAVLGQVEAYVRSKNNDGSIVPSTLGVADPVLSQLVGKLYGYELEYESLKKTTAENNPAMLSLKDRIDRLRPGILENIQSQRRSLDAGKNNIAATNSAYSSVIRSIPEKERALIDINREQNIKNGIYAYLLQKREDVALSHAATVSDGRIVDKAQTADAPVSPKRKVVFMTAFLAALFLGIGLVTAKESLGRTVMFRQDIEKFTAQPIIGEIAAIASREQIVIGADKKTFVAEQFRKLRATLPHIGISSTKKRILVTSAIAGEGKSFVATNLALTLALTGKKVILVDCDLNNPSLHKKLEMQSDHGVTQYLLEEAGLDEMIRPSGLDKNLFFIPAGRLPVNPSELLMNGKIEELLNELDGRFDYIVVDTAPVMPVTDAYAISPHCDATLFVVRHKYTPKIFVQRIDENNKINHLNNIAIVFNGISSRGFGSKNYGYGYGYGYIYNDSSRQPGLRISN